jgi:hypothetical protein
MIRKAKYSDETIIKVAEIEFSKYKLVYEIEPYNLLCYPVDFLNLYNDERLFMFEAKILINTQKWQLAIKDKFDETLTTSKNPELALNLFDQLPKMLVYKVLASHVFILNNLKEDNWKDSITDYIDYVVDSFGKVPNPLTVPIGMNEYIIYLLEILNKFDWIFYTKGYLERLVYILNYINTTYIKDEIERNNFESLLSIYDKWYREFPFDLQLFSEIKSKFSITLPILKKKPRINPYLGTEVFIFFTEIEMLDFIITITKTTLEAFKSKELVKKRVEYIRNDTKFNLELENKLHLTNQEKLVEEYSKGVLSYKSLINKWYIAEKKYLKKVLKQFNLNSDFQSFKIQISQGKWDYDRLKDFKEILENENFIKKMALSSFKRIFSGLKINNQIVWKTTLSDLKYLVNQLISIEIAVKEEGKVLKVKKKLLEETPQKHWDIAARCFKKENGLRFTPSVFKNFDNPANTHKLDLALKQLTQ